MDQQRASGLRVITSDTLPPNDVKLEQSILAVMAASDDGRVRAIAGGVVEAWFYGYSNRVIFRAIRRMAERGLAIDIVSLESDLRQHGELADAGGDSAVMNLFGRIPVVANTETYVAQLERLFRARQREASAIEAVRLIHEGEMDQAQRLLSKAAKPVDKKSEEPKPPRPVVAGARATALSLDPLTDSEYNALVRTIAAVAFINDVDNVADRQHWVAGIVYLVPFADGEVRSLALMRQGGDRFSDEEFGKCWAEALTLSNRPKLVGTPSLSQKIIDHIRSDGREDIIPISHGYGISGACFVRRNVEFREGAWIENEPTPITNFIAWVSAQSFQDDGTGQKERYLKVGGQMRGGELLPEFEIPAEDWTNISNWLHKYWGHTVVIFNRRSNTQSVLECMALYSMDAPVRHVYTHSGWIKVNGKHAYLAPGSIIGLTAAEMETFQRDASVTLSDVFRYYSLPSSVDHAQAAEGYRWIERVLRTAEMSVTAPLVASMFLAPIASFLRLNFILAFTGPSDSRKSSLVGAAMAAWGRQIDGESLPLSFHQTRNFLEDKLFRGKDMPVVIDNYVPSISQEQVKTLQGLAHAIGDNQGRGRMLDSQRSLSAKPCRGLVIITGEENCEQHSGQARMYVAPMNYGTVNLTSLTEIQIAAREGKLEPAMTHYIGWLANKLDEPGFIDSIRARWFDLTRSEQQAAATHGRMVAQRKWIDIGLELATQSHPVGRWADQRLMSEACFSLDHAAKDRGYTLKESSIPTAFFQSIKDLIDLGVVGTSAMHKTGHPPTIHADVFGWNTNSFGMGTHRTHEHAPVHLWVDRHEDLQQTAQWFVCLNIRNILKLMRDHLGDQFRHSESAVTAALYGRKMLWTSPGQIKGGNRSQSTRLPGGVRQRVVRINGDDFIKTIGFEEAGHDSAEQE